MRVTGYDFQMFLCSLFTILTSIFVNSSLDNPHFIWELKEKSVQNFRAFAIASFENWKRKVFKILEHLP